MTYHDPVLLEESVKGLNIRPEGTYADVTFGGGGHSGSILMQLGEKGRLFAFDQDPDAIANQPDDKRFKLINQNFSFFSNYLKLYNALPVDGLLADLGVSSHQFDTGSRGFSTRFEGPLDMRMNPANELSAAKVLNNYEERELSGIFSSYGELRQARAIAATIVEARDQQPLKTIGDLKKALEKYAPPGKENKFHAQVFQALRIEVNKELEALQKLLDQSREAVKKGGRLVIITYHSLEDRIVKNFIKKGKFSGELEKDFYGNPLRPFREVNRKPIVPSGEEIAKNPRARSAKLRIAEKI